jgi:hypothetical protein
MHGAGEPGGVLHACTYVHVRALACIEAAAPQALVDPEPDLVKALHYMHAGSSVYVHARYPTNAKPSLRFTCMRARILTFCFGSFPPFFL